MHTAIRAAGPNDIDVLTDFNCRLAAETEEKQLQPDTVRSGVTRGLSVGDEVRYFVAEADKKIVGQLMLTREWSDWRDGWVVWLQSVYVLADYRGQGVFRQLLDHVKTQIQNEPDVVCLRLYVEEDNDAAKSTYTRLGFDDTGYLVMQLQVPR
ncbi:MAG: GNAT family N-acetyltransferase [Fuerstiella sp.]|nr:GNAT family N-acetyltransferase [Fuerstiella sp.]MCP4786139.1 GNAT family N-acetyltransferase [Fuerstiella sp.]MCP4859417.1 GNAT family N-acetyltransferase [Fuerstiella sp.]